MHKFNSKTNKIYVSANVSAIPNSFNLFHHTLKVVAGLASVILYILAIFALRNLQHSNFSNRAQKKTRTRQIAITKTLGLVALCAAFLWVLPATVVLIFMILQISHRWYQSVMPYAYSCMLLNIANNVFIFAWKNRVFRRALKLILFGEGSTKGRGLMKKSSPVVGERLANHYGCGDGLTFGRTDSVFTVSRDFTRNSICIFESIYTMPLVYKNIQIMEHLARGTFRRMEVRRIYCNQFTDVPSK